MTRDEILAMKPGRELDALVMRTVFKAEKKDIGDECYWVSEVNGEEVCWPRWFSPSTDIAAAWEVEEEIEIQNKRVAYCQTLKIVLYSKDEYVGMFDYVHASPADRCKAALLAVMDG